MRLTIKDPGENVKRYYVQTLLMLFFPGQRYPEEDDGTSLYAEITVGRSDDGSAAVAYADICGVRGEGMREFALEGSVEISEERVFKIAVGRAVFAAASLYCGRRPPWGILIGVRPSKLACSYMNEGLSEEQTERLFIDDFMLLPEKAALVSEVAGHERRILSELPENGCSFYISIPFCPSRCAYCSFVSCSTPRLLSMIPDYIERVKRDIADAARRSREMGLKPYTIYIGGGTPSILTPEQIDSLMRTLNSELDLGELREFTFEAGRPDTITREKLAAIRAGGVNRISVNTQSLNDAVLASVGRRHTADDFYAAYDKAVKCGIQYINTDLICGLPGESEESFRRSVDGVLDIRPHNLTVHAFTVKKAADAAHDGYGECVSGEESAAAGIAYALDAARAAGYSPYYMYRQKNTVGNLENVGYSIPGAEGIYNILIMEEIQTIFGVGAGSVTKIVGADGRLERTFAPKYPYEYLA